ncbi:MAG TPA: protein kinase [Vicinamibacterales bacterium]|nr:protein kinase [Vicinamibacterales bacterium]
MSLSPGTRLGPYEILGPLGAGGMGEVYKARDTRLDRTVAIKVMAALSQADPGSRARFEREAKVLASFDHPHICALHDVGREGAMDFIVMPFVTGETLAARLAKGPLPLPQVIEAATQIADALDRAHGHGIIHRDLKPGNVMMTKSGARLLDFGLARLEEPPSSANPEDLATRSVLTKVGTVMGTVPYMSPEQLNGRPVDSRTDIWAFGCVLYEMIAGRPPFRGEGDASLMAAILRSEPEPLSKARPDVPPALDEIVLGALVKDPEDRWQSMRDIKRALAIAGRSGSATAPAQLPASRQGRGLVVPLLAVTTVLLAGLAWVGWQRQTSPGLVRFDVNAMGSGIIQNFTDTRPFFAASPDGRSIAYVATVSGSTDIWIKRVDSDRPEKLADTRGAAVPFWSPDGQSIGFYGDGGVKRKALAGGPALKLCDTDSQGINATWNNNDVILFSDWGTRKILKVPANGGAAVVVREGKNPLTWAHFLPDGRHFLYSVYDLQALTRQLFVGSLDSTDDVPVSGISSRAEFAAGHLVYWHDGGLVAQPFDLKTYQVSGQPIPLADDVHAFEATGFAAFSATRDLLIYQAGPVEERLVWLDRQGVERGTVGPPNDYVEARLSPDGRALAAAVRDRRLGTSDVIVHELDRDLTRPLTSDRGTENGPIWSPDSKSIVFAADRHGPPNLHLRSADGNGTEREVVPPVSGPLAAGSFTRDGRSLVFLQPNPGTNYDIMLAPIDKSAAPVAVVATKGRENSPRLSPDGRWLAYTSNESGRSQVYVQSWPEGLGRRQVSRDGGTSVRWRGDSKELFFIAGGAAFNQLMAMPVIAPGDTIEPATPQLLFVARGDLSGYDVTKDGQKFLVISPDRVAERGTLSVIAHWAGLLRK